MQRDFCLPTQHKQDPEAELIFHKAKEVHVKSEPEKQNYKYLTLKSTFFTPRTNRKEGFPRSLHLYVTLLHENYL